ncbi:hypothetical protein TD95_000785, partial [Thielaviopsis punctulata]
HIKSLSKPHKAVQHQISQEKFSDAKRYKLARLRFNIASGLWAQIVNALMVLYGVTLIWNFSTSIQHALASPSVLWQSVIFLVLYTSTQSALEVPVGYYDTFYVEGKHGFNNSSVKTYIFDQVKTFFITGIIIAIVSAASLKIVDLTGDSFFVYLLPAIICLQTFIQTIHPIFILPFSFLFSHVPLEDGELRTELAKLADKLSFPLHDVYVMDGSSRSSHSSAFFTGFPWKKQIFLYDTFLKQMTITGVVAVLAHELGHWSLSHMFVITGVEQLLFVIVLGLLLPSSTTLRSMKLSKSPAILLRLTLVLADRFAAQQGCRMSLSCALTKLQKENLSVGSDDWLYSCYFNNHPSIVERLENLAGEVDESKPLLHQESS